MNFNLILLCANYGNAVLSWFCRRSVLVRGGSDKNEEASDVTPKEFSIRTVAQEYGGGAFSISGETLVFSNYKDQRLYKQSIDSKGSTY